jgi:hypothetical protein
MWVGGGDPEDEQALREDVVLVTRSSLRRKRCLTNGTESTCAPAPNACSSGMERMLSGERWSTSVPCPRKRLDQLPVIDPQTRCA